MGNVLSKYIEQYNRLIKREKKGAAYLDNPDIPTQEKEKWIGEFQKIIKALNGLIPYIEKAAGRKMTSDEILNGFIGASGKI